MTSYSETSYIQPSLSKKGYLSASFIGLILFIIVFICGGLWSILAQLDGGAFAIGRVIVQNKTQTIQHLEGGVIAELPVKNGDYVKKDQILLVLNDIKARADSQRLTGQYYRLKAAQSRLSAEQSLFKSNPVFIPQTPADIRSSQLKLFNDNMTTYRGRVLLLQEKKALIQREHSGLNQKIQHLNRQINLESGLRDKKAYLVNQGYAAINQLSEQEVRLNELQKEKADTETAISTAFRRMTETDLEIDNTNNEFILRASEEMKTIESNLIDVSEELEASKDVLTRTNITAPIDGTITNLELNTIGGVIPPATAIMSIVPKDTLMLVEAKVRPQDINSVHVDQKARIHFTAYKSVKVPAVSGVVTYVSADTKQDQTTGENYYTATITPDKEVLNKLSEKITLTAGMPADVTISTGERTPLDYLISPIKDSLRKSFTEE
jgi:HlyD family type I secretion membrane fusion protein